MTAKRGNRVSVGKLVHILMQDIHKYTPEILEALVSQLRPEVLTKVVQVLNQGQTLPPALLYAKETGSMAISGVYMASLGCVKHPAAKPTTVAIIRRNLHTILTWILIDLGHRPGFIDTRKPVKAEEPSFILHAGLLRGIMDMDSTLEADILASPVAIDIALVMWSSHTADNKPLFLAHQKFRIREAGCAIIDVVLRFVRLTRLKTPAPIVTRLSAQSAPCDEDTFIKRLIARGAVLATMARARQDTMNYLKVLVSCRALAEINHYFILRRSSPYTLKMHTTTHVILYSNILTSLTRARIDEEVQDQYVERIAELFLFIFTEWVLRSPTAFQRNLVDCLSGGGLLSAIPGFLNKSSLSQNTLEKVFKLIQQVKTSLIFPVAVNTLPKLVVRNSEWAPQGRAPRGVQIPVVEVRNEMLALGYEMKTAYESIPRKFPICDSLAVSQPCSIYT